MCKECEKRGTLMVIAPLRKHFSSISSANIEEFCLWFREGKGIVTVRFEAEDITVTIGLNAEIKMLEKALTLPCYAPLQYEKLKEILINLTQ